jgi:glycosyltransferase involved in cell wall biosynthesis
MKGAFERAGVRTVVLVSGPGADESDVVHAFKPPGVAARAWGKLRPRAPDAAWEESLASAVRRLAKREGVELIEMEESFGWCGAVAERAGVPVVGRLHGPWFLNGPAVGAPKDATYEKRLERERCGILACHGVTSPSADVLERTRRFYGMALPEAEVIPCPIEPRPEAERWREEACEPELVLFVGRFDRHKAGDVMLEGFARVAARRPRAKLLFVGPDNGCAADDGRKWTLPDYLERFPLSVRERVEWAGFWPNAELPALRRRAAVTVVCSRYENFGYAVLEGLAHGCPMVVSRTGGLVEMVEHEAAHRDYLQGERR